MHRNRIPFMTLKRWIRKRVALEQSKTSGSGILDEGATFSDVHSVVLDPTSKLPYPQKVCPYRNKKKSTNAIVFDHIPLQEQIVCLFPGQGAQYVGMGSKLVDCAKAKEVFDRSSEILGYDVLKLCMQGPKTKLDQTLYCQPAIFVSSMACVEKFKASDETIADRITDAAGFSVGEFSALVTGGILKFDDALRVVHARAEAMHECNQLVRSGMLTIKVNASSRLGEAMYDAISISRYKLQPFNQYSSPQTLPQINPNVPELVQSLLRLVGHKRRFIVHKRSYSWLRIEWYASEFGRLPAVGHGSPIKWDFI